MNGVLFFNNMFENQTKHWGNSFYPFFIISFRKTRIYFLNCYSNNLWEHPSPIHYLHFILFTLSQLLNLRILTNKIKNSKGSVLKSFSSRYSFLSQCMARNSFHVLLVSPHVMRYGLPLTLHTHTHTHTHLYLDTTLFLYTNLILYRSRHLI